MEKVHVVIELDMEVDDSLHTKLHDFCKINRLGTITEDQFHKALEHGPICDAIMAGNGEVIFNHQ